MKRKLKKLWHRTVDASGDLILTAAILTIVVLVCVILLINSYPPS